MPSLAKDRWTELNIGPFYIYTDSDSGAARDWLTQLEQLRWVMGGLFESQNLLPLWPVRILLTDPPGSPDGKFVSQNGTFVLATSPRTSPPLDQIAKLLLEPNTPRLPAEVESGLIALCSTLHARGSRVTWGGAPAHPDLAWARMQMFATRFEYGASFHIFLGALQGGSDLRAAERNAFGKDAALLEKEAAANLQAGHWEPVPVPGRPLDPKRDLGEHSADAAVVGVYLADARLSVDPKGAEAAYKAAIEAGGPARLLGLEGMASLVERDKQDPSQFLEAAQKAGTRSAPVYYAAALQEGIPPEQAVTLLKKAAQLNPLWPDPLLEAGRLATEPGERVELLKKSTQVSRRCTDCWIALAEAQAALGQASAAQGSWLRAEDSVPDSNERDRIHKQRLDSEQARLDAAEAAQRQERESAHLADQRAQQAQEERIRAAERRANSSLDSAAGTGKPAEVVPWQEMVPKKKLTGVLRKIECIGATARLTVAGKAGPPVLLLLKRPADNHVACDASQVNRTVSVMYAAEDDERFKTSGTILNIEFR